MAIGTAIGLGLQGAKLITGAVQAGIGAKRMQSLDRPDYNIPDEVRQNLTAAQQAEMEGLPTAVKNEYIQNLQRNQAAALSGGSERGAGLAGIGGVLSAQQDAYTSLMAKDAMARQQARQATSQARSQMAGYKDRQYQEQLANYQQDLMGAQGMLGAGMQNIAGSADSASSMLIDQETFGTRQTPEANAPGQQMSQPSNGSGWFLQNQGMNLIPR